MAKLPGENSKFSSEKPEKTLENIRLNVIERFFKIVQGASKTKQALNKTPAKNIKLLL